MSDVTLAECLRKRSSASICACHVLPQATGLVLGHPQRFGHSSRFGLRAVLSRSYVKPSAHQMLNYRKSLEAICDKVLMGPGVRSRGRAGGLVTGDHHDWGASDLPFPPPNDTSTHNFLILQECPQTRFTRANFVRSPPPSLSPPPPRSTPRHPQFRISTGTKKQVRRPCVYILHVA